MLRSINIASAAVLLFLVTMLAGPFLRLASDDGAQAQSWRTASREPVGWAPAPEDFQPALVQAYCAPAYSWRGAFADHCWIAAKPEGASAYSRYEVIGFRLRRTGSAVVISETPTPDREWYGAFPKLMQDLRGEKAEAVIAKLPGAVASYPYPKEYTVWPGPNSNTFIAHVAREVPELELALPSNAIGKDFTGASVVAAAPSGTGYQVSLGGILGLTLARKEGFEVNVLGLVFGANPLNFTLSVPGFGRVPSRINWTEGETKDAVPMRVSDAALEN